MRSERGFTLVEILVTMLIVGVLAALGLPTFMSQAAKGHDASAKTVMRSAVTAIETYATETQDRYAGATTPVLEEIEPTLKGSGLISEPSDDGYELTVSSAKSGNVFFLSKSKKGKVKRTCRIAGQAGCPPSGKW